MVFVVGLLGNILGFFLLGTAGGGSWRTAVVSPRETKVSEVVGCVLLFVVVTVSVFFLSLSYPLWPGAPFLVALLITGAYVGHRLRQFDVFFKVLFGGCVVAGTAIFIVIGSDIPAFLALLRKNEAVGVWLRAVEPFFNVDYWFAYSADRHIFVALRVALVYAGAMFVILSVGNLLRYLISNMTTKKL